MLNQEDFSNGVCAVINWLTKTLELCNVKDFTEDVHNLNFYFVSHWNDIIPHWTENCLLGDLVYFVVVWSNLSPPTMQRFWILGVCQSLSPLSQLFSQGCEKQEQVS